MENITVTDILKLLKSYLPNGTMLNESFIYNTLNILTPESYDSSLDFDAKLKNNCEKLIEARNNDLSNADPDKRVEIENNIRVIKFCYMLISNEESRSILKDEIRKFNDEKSKNRDNDQEIFPIGQNQLEYEFIKARIEAERFEKQFKNQIESNIIINSLHNRMDIFADLDSFRNEFYIKSEITSPTIKKQEDNRPLQYMSHINKSEETENKMKRQRFKTRIDSKMLLNDKEYRDFVLNELLSDEAVEFANKYTNGYVGEPKKIDGKWKRFFNPECTHMSKVFRTQGRDEDISEDPPDYFDMYKELR